MHCFMVWSYVCFVLKKLLLRSHGRRYQGSRGEIPRLVCHHRVGATSEVPWRALNSTEPVK